MIFIINRVWLCVWLCHSQCSSSQERGDQEQDPSHRQDGQNVLRPTVGWVQLVRVCVCACVWLKMHCFLQKYISSDHTVPFWAESFNPQAWFCVFAGAQWGEVCNSLLITCSLSLYIYIYPHTSVTYILSLSVSQGGEWERVDPEGTDPYRNAAQRCAVGGQTDPAERWVFNTLTHTWTHSPT